MLLAYCFLTETLTSWGLLILPILQVKKKNLRLGEVMPLVITFETGLSTLSNATLDLSADKQL